MPDTVPSSLRISAMVERLAPGGVYVFRCNCELTDSQMRDVQAMVSHTTSHMNPRPVFLFMDSRFTLEDLNLTQAAQLFRLLADVRRHSPELEALFREVTA